MSIWVKICGNTSLVDTMLAVEAGADAVGFVFAPSPRRVTVAQVAAIVPGLPHTVNRIGVFVDGDFDRIAAAVEACGLNGVQLHGDGSAATARTGLPRPDLTRSDLRRHDLAHRLRERFGAELLLLQVVHFSTTAWAEVQRTREDSALDGILIDSRTATAVGGTGVAFDWVAAQAEIFGAEGLDGIKGLAGTSGLGTAGGDQRRMGLIAAGGLNPENVAEAIGLLRPWGVDVASGVEASPGRKDASKVKEFVQRARAAALRSE